MKSPIDLEELEKDKTRLLELALGFECAAESENCVVAGMQAYVEAFRRGPVDPETLRRLRVYNEAKANMKQFQEDAAAIRNILKRV